MLAGQGTLVSTYLCLPSTEIISTHHHAWLFADLFVCFKTELGKLCLQSSSPERRISFIPLDTLGFEASALYIFEEDHV